MRTSSNRKAGRRSPGIPTGPVTRPNMELVMAAIGLLSLLGFGILMGLVVWTWFTGGAL